MDWIRRQSWGPILIGLWAVITALSLIVPFAVPVWLNVILLLVGGVLLIIGK